MRIAAWLMAIAVIVVSIPVLLVDLTGGIHLLAAFGIALGVASGLAAAYRKRVALARKADERVAAERTGEISSRRSSVACHSLTRGNGVLVVDDLGDVSFQPAPIVLAREAAYAGIDLAVTDVARLLGRRLKCVLHSGFRRQQAEKNREILIRRSQLRLAIPVDRFVMGPSVLIGYQPAGKADAVFEEFCLSVRTGSDVRMPTADAADWVACLRPPLAEPSMEQQALAWRRSARRRAALADVGLGLLVSGMIFALFIGMLDCLLWAQDDLRTAAILTAALGGIWAGVGLLTAAVHCFHNR